MPFEIIRNDITKMKVDAIVNAANNSLLGGGGVDGAIHRAAGPELLEECRGLHGCETGKAKMTGGYRLPCRYVIHTVGPIWNGGGYGERELLASCYRESLRLATEHGCESVAFPLISSGAYGYPKDQALKVATDTILAYLPDHDLHVYLVVFERDAYLISKKLYANIQAYIDDSYIGPDYEREERRRRYAHMNLPRPTAAGREGRTADMLPDAEPEFGKDFLWEDMAPAMEHSMAPAEIPSDLGDYVSRLDEGFRDMLLRKIDEQKITDAECYKRANIDRKLFNKIKNQADYRPGKSTVLALAVSLRLPLDETREMLEKAGFSLTHSSRFDLIVEYFILHGQYDVFAINEALFSFDQKLLGSVSP